MIPALTPQNFLSWMAQIAVVVLVGLPLPGLLRIRHPRSQFIYYKLLLALCLALPFLQPWHHPIDSNIGDQLNLSVLGALGSTVQHANRGLWLEGTALWILLGGIALKLRVYGGFIATE